MTAQARDVSCFGSNPRINIPKYYYLAKLTGLRHTVFSYGRCPFICEKLSSNSFQAAPISESRKKGSHREGTPESARLGIEILSLFFQMLTDHFCLSSWES